MLGHHRQEIAKPPRSALPGDYLGDESGTDNNSLSAVLGGLALSTRQAAWLDIELRQCLDEFKIPWPLSMKEFGSHGRLQDMRSEQRRPLFQRIARIINENKSFSVASVLSSSQYRTAFNGLTELSMYGAAFLIVALANCVGASEAGYSQRTPYLLDAGNAFKQDIEEAHSFLARSKYSSRIGTLSFEPDENLAPRQAADVVAWAVRRREDFGLKSGFEPLSEILLVDHNEIPYSDDLMIGVASEIRAKLGH